MESKEIFELADRLKSCKDRKKELETETKALNVEIEELDKQLSDAMAESELERFARNGSTFYLSSRLFASPVAGRKDDMISTLKENGFAELVSETVNANTLASFCREQMEENGDSLPEWMADVVHTYEKVSVGIRKA